MTSQLYLSRVTLRRDAPDVAPLLQILQPREEDERVNVEHRLLWTIMPDDVREAVNTKRTHGEMRSAFLWRSEQPHGKYFVLGPKPRDDSGLFTIESKSFEPNLSEGDRLAFDLRVHATVDRKVGTDQSGKAIRKRCDVALDLMTALERAAEAKHMERSKYRTSMAEQAARDWLSARAEMSGFRTEMLKLDAYRTVRLPGKGRRGRIGKPYDIGVFDLKGTLSVADPGRFVQRLASGFGRAKAFGCGLMLVRRIQ